MATRSDVLRNCVVVDTRREMLRVGVKSFDGTAVLVDLPTAWAYGYNTKLMGINIGLPKEAILRSALETITKQLAIIELEKTDGT